jgi:hypothetical protein
MNLRNRHVNSLFPFIANDRLDHKHGWDAILCVALL